MGVNCEYPYLETNYIFLSNLRRYRELAKEKRHKCIVTSNVSADLKYLQTDYQELLNEHNMVQDNAGLMAIKFFINCNVNAIYIAGMDRYSQNISENYGNSDNSFIARKEYFDEINSSISDVLEEYATKIEIHFLTKEKNVHLRKESKNMKTQIRGEYWNRIICIFAKTSGGWEVAA